MKSDNILIAIVSVLMALAIFLFINTHEAKGAQPQKFDIQLLQDNRNPYVEIYSVKDLEYGTEYILFRSSYGNISTQIRAK